MEKAESWYALTEFFIVLMSCIALSIFPQVNWSPLILACLPVIIRIIRSSKHRKINPIDLFILIFLLTSSVGLWAAYSQELALQRFFSIIAATMLCYSIAHQPKRNLWFITIGLGIWGIATTILFLLMNNWLAFPADIDLINQVGRRWAEIRSTTDFKTGLDSQLFHPNIVGGINAILLPITIVATYYFWKVRRIKSCTIFFIISSMLIIGLILTSSRAAWVATFLGLTFLGALKLTKFRKLITTQKYIASSIPILIIIIGIISPLITNNNLDGSNPLADITSFSSRLEIARNTFFLITDFPFTGGGLGSFPGLYSQYILVIPFFMFSYSHNLFLDLALEQGIFGFVIWGCIIFFCASALWSALIKFHRDRQNSLFASATYTSLIIFLLHGIADDPIYSNKWGLTIFFLIPGFSIAVSGSKGRLSIHPQNTSRTILIAFVILSVIIIGYHKQIKAALFANIGAVNMTKVELNNWPTGKWNEGSNLSVYNQAEMQLKKSLMLLEDNLTSNYRLGMLSMKDQEFQRAVGFLETAYEKAPQHRGITKTLGYCYTWLGKYDKAFPLLEHIPEAQTEMQTYIWWWQNQDREDLAENAYEMSGFLMRE